jgi:hypothetical protein
MIKTMSCAFFVFSSLFVVCIVDCVIELVVDLRQPETEHIVSHWPLKKGKFAWKIKTQKFEAREKNAQEEKFFGDDRPKKYVGN